MMNDYRLNMREEIYMKADLFDNIFTVLVASNRNNCDERNSHDYSEIYIEDDDYLLDYWDPDI